MCVCLFFTPVLEEGSFFCGYPCEEVPEWVAVPCGASFLFAVRPHDFKRRQPELKAMGSGVRSLLAKSQPCAPVADGLRRAMPHMTRSSPGAQTEAPVGRHRRHPDGPGQFAVALVIVYRTLGQLLPEHYDPDRRSLR